MSYIRLFTFCCIITSSALFSMQAPLQGDIFTAIPIPDNMKPLFLEVQNDVAQCLGNIHFSPSPLANLHITIQLPDSKNTVKIADVLQDVPATFKAHAQKFKTAKGVKNWDHSWDFSGKLQAGSIKIGKGGHVKLHLGESTLLVHLGELIQQALQKAGIATKRNDVTPNYSAHITLGMVAKNDSTVAQKKKCTIDLRGKFTKHKFIIDRFVLLQSNRPAMPRVYHKQAEYLLHLGE